MKISYIFSSILIFSIAVGCEKPKTHDDSGRKLHKFRLQDGLIVSCEYAHLLNCGITLNACTDDRQYICQTNVTEIK